VENFERDEDAGSSERLDRQVRRARAAEDSEPAEQTECSVDVCSVKFAEAVESFERFFRDENSLKKV
jgi:hypothetical protein